MPGRLNAGQPRQLHGQDLTIKKQESRKRLILGGGNQVPLVGKPGQEQLHFPSAEFSWIATLVESNEVADPIGICLLSSLREPKSAYTMANLVQQIWESRACGWRNGADFEIVDIQPCHPPLISD